MSKPKNMHPGQTVVGGQLHEKAMTLLAARGKEEGHSREEYLEALCEAEAPEPVLATEDSPERIHARSLTSAGLAEAVRAEVDAMGLTGRAAARAFTEIFTAEARKLADKGLDVGHYGEAA